MSSATGKASGKPAKAAANATGTVLIAIGGNALVLDGEPGRERFVAFFSDAPAASPSRSPASSKMAGPR